MKPHQADHHNADNSVKRTRKVENKVYWVIWLLVIVISIIYIIRERSEEGLDPLVLDVIAHVLVSFVPFFILFAFNNWILMPGLLFRNKMGLYFRILIISLFLFWIWQYFHFTHSGTEMDRISPPPPPPPPRSVGDTPSFLMPIPLPLMLDFTFSVITIGINLAIALLFRMIDDRIEKERLMKINVENQLIYLNTQINPHFYMNMLNNIHGMIEIDPTKAQVMLLEMSHLLRYTLYDSSRLLIGLNMEIDFLKKFLHLMRQRYPKEKLRIKAEFPSREECNGIEIPPLLFIVFIENAFKHGISYSHPSFVDVLLKIEENRIFFSCINSINKTQSPDGNSNGIGLKNVRTRLHLLYDDECEFSTEIRNGAFYAFLSIPVVTNRFSHTE